MSLHAVAFIAVGHALADSSGSPAPDRPEPVIIEVAVESMDERGEPLVAVPGPRSAAFVPPPHTHRDPVSPDHDAHPPDRSLVHVPFAVSPSTSAVAGAMAAPSAPARFTMVVTSEDRGGPAAPAAAGTAANPEPGSDAVPLPEEGVSSRARLERPLDCAYPAAARAQEVEADIVLAIVVASTGKVAEARVVRPAGFGFDEEALRAVRAAQFAPAQRGGRSVAVRMRYSVSFRLHGQGP